MMCFLTTFLCDLLLCSNSFQCQGKNRPYQHHQLTIPATAAAARTGYHFDFHGDLQDPPKPPVCLRNLRSGAVMMKSPLQAAVLQAIRKFHRKLPVNSEARRRASIENWNKWNWWCTSACWPNSEIWLYWKQIWDNHWGICFSRYNGSSSTVATNILHSILDNSIK